MSRTLGRTELVTDGGPPRCPDCGARLAFATDRQGRTMEQCHCGYRAYVRVRDSAAPPAPPLTP